MGENRASVDAIAESGRGRCFNNVLWLTDVFSATSLVLEAVKSYTVCQVTSPEKQFGLSSTRRGLPHKLQRNRLSFNYMLLHFGGRRFIPRFLSCALAVYGIVSLMSSMLHFMDPVSLPLVEDVSSNYSSPQSARLCQDSLQENERYPAAKDVATDKGNWAYHVYGFTRGG